MVHTIQFLIWQHQNIQLGSILIPAPASTVKFVSATHQCNEVKKQRKEQGKINYTREKILSLMAVHTLYN
uniref:Uncharacterized protein n=1 Tax=Arundo donax TaxID=35708 RepID=A0A0A8YY45_ARUDO